MVLCGFNPVLHRCINPLDLSLSASTKPLLKKNKMNVRNIKHFKMNKGKSNKEDGLKQVNWILINFKFMISTYLFVILKILM